jgi:hypothetical protein
MPDETAKPWMIRDVPEYIRRKVKLYAIQHGMTLPQALELIVNQVVHGKPEDVMQDPRGEMPTFPPPRDEE